MKYNHKKIEKKWQKEWEKSKLYQTPDRKKGAENFYTLVEFPYPSGNLHTGHWYAFSVPDIFVRAKRMQGKNVLFPIGFDAFGLPAENAAIQRKLNPYQWTISNISYMRKQLRSMGASFDWSREVVTCDPAYYRWTQWIFLQFFKRGLAYQAETPVNWCPKDKTVLANEQVAAGKCERCGTVIEQRTMKQWMLKITDYADKLLNGLEKLNWPEEIKEAQRNWIGRSEGAEIDFEIKPYSKYVLVHGFQGSPKHDQYQWLKNELEQRGADVVLPKLPRSGKPQEDEQVKSVLYSTTFDTNTVLYGKSLGASVVLKVVEKLKQPIAGLVLAGGFVHPSGLYEKHPFDNTFRWEFDFEKIKKNCGFIKIVSDLSDRAVKPEQGKILHKNLGGELCEVVAQKPHFDNTVEPAILNALVSKIKVFTTRPDTLFGATYMVLAPEHHLVESLKSRIKNWREISEYIKKSKSKTELERQQEKEKTGVELKGIKAINTATKEEIPIFIADYVLAHYGTGAIMAVPAHDERDFEFAKKFGLPIQYVIAPIFETKMGPDAIQQKIPTEKRKTVVCVIKHWAQDKYICLRWKNYGWRTFVVGGVEDTEDLVMAGMREAQEETGYQNMKFIRHIPGPEIHNKFFARHKGKNRWAIIAGLYFELTDGLRQDLAEEEKNTHEVVWVDKDQVANFLFDDESDQILWRNFLGQEQAHMGDGILINSGKFDGMKSEDAKRAIAEFVGGKMTVQYKLRDWVLSRQRYWGTPIPLVYCVRCGDNIKNQPVLDRVETRSGKLKPQNDGEKQNPGWFAVTEKELPVKLPEIKDYLPTGDGKSPLAKATKWAKTKCPKCKADAERETDTMDTFVDSSWYFLRYCDPDNKTKFADSKKMKRWMPVDRYSGGAEHTTMHLLYSRFWIKAMHDCGFVEWDEPYAMRMNRGIILGPDGQKMSKSKGNVVDPDEYVQKLGADTVRMYLAFIGPYSEVGSYPWNPHGILGVRRFLDRVFALSKTISYAEPASEPARRGFTMARRREDEQSNQTSSGLRREADEKVLRILHKTIKKVTEDIEQFRFNTAISQLMILLNELEKHSGITALPHYSIFLKLLAPFAPHLADELWYQRGGRTAKSIHQEPWPMYDPKLVEDNTFELVIQINGKVRDKVSAPIDISQKEAERLTFSREKVKNILGSHQPRKVIFIPKRLINIVL